ncbi:uncharacterized protein FOMMEDRAFT_149813 [Fomitiporia mediterranea MF3/22]|uniref:uncharacterized protein n=1 Tax=Fomitiporia mediterranea (strain MF3/22) TaxID=694068 RepID=UPI000440912B|nr:uncharacterized protein FOMMEDRAFT_149813 [Fomitiporia mediterranea MF3/22]EJD07298.1 hypothetical protein FOMMEDRAFT_149813 [Fomitiporia mediterranea MF3/22]
MSQVTREKKCCDLLHLHSLVFFSIQKTAADMDSIRRSRSGFVNIEKVQLIFLRKSGTSSAYRAAASWTVETSCFVNPPSWIALVLLETFCEIYLLRVSIGISSAHNELNSSSRFLLSSDMEITTRILRVIDIDNLGANGGLQTDMASSIATWLSSTARKSADVDKPLARVYPSFRMKGQRKSSADSRETRTALAFSVELADDAIAIVS